MSNYEFETKPYYNAIECPECGTPYSKVELGIYVCRNCGYEEESTLGRVRTYITEHEDATVSDVASALDIPVARVNHYIKKGRIEIKEDSTYFLSCHGCGISIRYGKFCPKCASHLAADLAGTLEEGEIGEVPTSRKDRNPKMRFLTV